MPDDPWTAHPILFSGASKTMKLEIDSRSNVRITTHDAAFFISTDLDGLGDLYALIERACGKPDEPTEKIESAKPAKAQPVVDAHGRHPSWRGGVKHKSKDN